MKSARTASKKGFAMKRITTGLALLVSAFLSCDSPWDELLPQRPSTRLTLYRAPQGATASGVLLVADALLESRQLTKKSHCVRLRAQLGTLETGASQAMAAPAAAELALPLSATLPYRALALYHPGRGTAAQTDLVLAELFTDSACSDLAGAAPTARTALTLDLSDNQTTGSAPAMDMSAADLTQ